MVVGMSTACFFPEYLYRTSRSSKSAKMQIRNAEVFFSCLSEYQIPFVKEVKKRADDRGIQHIFHTRSFTAI